MYICSIKYTAVKFYVDIKESLEKDIIYHNFFLLDINKISIKIKKDLFK